MWATCRGRLRRSLPYLVLLQVGFAMPRVLPPARCALTAPFHPYRCRLRGHLGGIFLLHCPWAHAPQVLPGTSPDGARTFLHVLAHTATAWPTLGTAPYAGMSINAIAGDIGAL